MTVVRWTHGDAALHAEIERQLASGAAQRLHDNPRRIVLRMRCARGDVLVKQFRVGSGRHALRERWKARFGRAPAEREWRMLSAMQAAGVPAPEPLALGSLPDGDRLLALRWVDGVDFETALPGEARARRDLLAALAALVRRVHAAGFVHGDLHLGNLLVDARGPVLLDWQHARATRNPRALRADLARLEFSLAPHVSRGRRLRMRESVLGIERPLDAASRAALREAGDASDARARDHAQSRTESVCRPGRVAARFDGSRRSASPRYAGSGDVTSARGLRLRELEEGALVAILDAHRDAIAKQDARLLKSDVRSSVTGLEVAGLRVVVKETPFRGVARALADVARGSAGFRAWRAGHGLSARRIGAARPLAYGESKRLGVPVASWVVLEDLRPAADAAFAVGEGAASADDVLDALTHFAIALHRAGVDHGDLKATHILLSRTLDGLVPQLIDLEGVRFMRQLSDDRRLRALAELNASLPDAYPAAPRRRAFRRYAAALPFAIGWRAARARIVRESLARRHRWTGADCDVSPSPPPATGSSSTTRGSCRRGRS
jgi:tRNA A-37 threonylcarbamoyl transferase component Bud32